MNYCRKCQSDYEKPGTCNCFAPQVAAPQPTFVPYVPQYQPWLAYPVYYPWGQTYTTNGSNLTGSCTVTTDQPYQPTNVLRLGDVFGSH